MHRNIVSGSIEGPDIKSHTYKTDILVSIHCRVLGGLYVAVFDGTALIRKLSTRRIDLPRFLKGIVLLGRIE